MTNVKFDTNWRFYVFAKAFRMNAEVISTYDAYVGLVEYGSNFAEGHGTQKEMDIISKIFYRACDDKGLANELIRAWNDDADWEMIHGENDDECAVFDDRDTN